MPGNVLSASCTLPGLTLTIIPGGRCYCYCFWFKNEDTEVQRLQLSWGQRSTANAGAEFPTMYKAPRITFLSTMLSDFPKCWSMWCRNYLIFYRWSTPSFARSVALLHQEHIHFSHSLSLGCIASSLLPTTTALRIGYIQLAINLPLAFYFFHCPFSFFVFQW